MVMPSLQDFVFDIWAQLAKQDPDEFELQRRAYIQQYIEDLPQERRERMQRLQWRIDMERQRASNPMSACLRLYQMMWDSFAGELGLINTLKEPDHYIERKYQKKAKILPFNR